MYRFLAVTFSTSVIFTSIFAVLNPQDGISILVSTDYIGVFVRVALAMLLLAYSISPRVRYELPRKAVLFSGCGILLYFFFSLMSDNTLFPKPVDLFFGLQGAILGFIAGLDFARPKAVQKFMPNITVLELLAARISKLRGPALPSPQKQKPA